MLEICNEINATHKCVKMYCEENTAVLQIEQYVSSMKEYMQVFYSNLKALESANDVFEKLYDDKKPVVMSVSQPVVSTIRKNFDSVFFPVLGVYLGKTTTIELRNKGQNPIDEQGITYNIEGVIFKDTDGDAIIDYMYITRSTIMPQQWIKAVSYTHLDVYKRQVLGGNMNAETDTIDLGKSGQNNPGGATVIRHVNPTGGTGMASEDVYKRQIYV